MFVVRRHGRRPPALTSRRANPLLKMAPPALRAIEKLNRKRETCPAAARPTAIIITWMATSKGREIIRPISCRPRLCRNIERNGPAAWLMGRRCRHGPANIRPTETLKYPKSAIAFAIFSRQNRWGKRPFSGRASSARRSRWTTKKRSSKTPRKMSDRPCLICDDATIKIAITWLPTGAGHRRRLLRHLPANHRQLAARNRAERRRRATVQIATNLWNVTEEALQSTSVWPPLLRPPAFKTARRLTASSTGRAAEPRQRPGLRRQSLKMWPFDHLRHQRSRLHRPTTIR